MGLMRGSWWSEEWAQVILCSPARSLPAARCHRRRHRGSACARLWQAPGLGHAQGLGSGPCRKTEGSVVSTKPPQLYPGGRAPCLKGGVGSGPLTGVGESGVEDAHPAGWRRHAGGPGTLAAAAGGGGSTSANFPLGRSRHVPRHYRRGSWARQIICSILEPAQGNGRESQPYPAESLRPGTAAPP